MCAYTRSISTPTLRTGRRSERGRLILGLLKLAVRELAATALVLAGASLLLFLVLKAAPNGESRFLRLERGDGDTRAAQTAPGAASDMSSFTEYAKWLGSAAVGDFGQSASIQKGRPAADLIWPAALDSFLLLVAGMLLAIAIALAMAVWRTFRSGSVAGRLTSYLLSLLSSIPVFLYVYMFVAVGNRAISLGAAKGYWTLPQWFPLPMTPALAPWLVAALILAVGDGGLVDLFQRFSSELGHASGGDHLTGARVLGLSVPWEIARGFMPGAINHVTRRISFFLGSMVVLEATLAWPGMGYLAWRAAGERDMPVLLGSTLVMAATLRVTSICGDIVGYLADPRRRSP